MNATSAHIAKCSNCHIDTAEIWLISNFAGGTANACELLACVDCRWTYLKTASHVLDRALIQDGDYLEVFADDNHFVKADRINPADAAVLAMVEPLPLEWDV